MPISSYEAIKNLHVERQLFLARLWFAAITAGVLSLVLMGWLLRLQVLQHEYYTTRSDENRMRLTVVAPVRGLMYDRHGVLMAQNAPAWVLEVVPENVPKLDDTLARLSKLINVTPADVTRFRDRMRKTPKYRGVPLRTNLTLEEVARYQINRYEFEGVDIVAGLTRQYPLGESAAHVVGYIGGITEDDLEGFSEADDKAYRGTNYIGRTGVEKSHESILHGLLGTKIVETNASGRPLRELPGLTQRGTPGLNLFLSLDAKLQLTAEKALGDRNGAVVAIDPATGEVLVLVSKPGFDPQLFVEGVDPDTYRALNADEGAPLFNRALQGQYSPGSTIKPFMALAGLEYGAIDPGKREFCSGEMTLPGSTHKYRCYKRTGHGWMDLDHAIQQSCDVYFYQTALALGIDHIYSFLTQFGLGRPTEVDLPIEKSGLVPSREWKRRARKEAWYSGETLITGIGQGSLSVTPFQLAQIASRMAMRGGGYKPHLVHATQDAMTGTVTAIKPEALPPIELRDSYIWDRVINAMHSVTQSPGGTAFRAIGNAPYTVAGKTGTVQVSAMSQDELVARKLQDVPEKLRDHALFIAFAPIENPKIAIAVLAEHVGHGGSEAAPVARKVLDAYLLPEGWVPPAKAAKAAAPPAADDTERAEEPDEAHPPEPVEEPTR